MEHWAFLLAKFTPIKFLFISEWQTPTPPPWWQVTENEVPYVIILGIALITFILGGLARPIVDSLGNALLQWVKGWGKRGDFRKRYLTEIISRSRHLALLPANVVAARWQYRRRAVELEKLYTPLSLGEERADIDPDEKRNAVSTRKFQSRKEPRNWIQTLWWKIRPPIEPSAGRVGEIIDTHSKRIIRGDPGSGKTTLLRYLAITCARSLRNDQRDGDDSKMIKKRLGWRRQRFPFLVNLGLFSDVTRWPKDRRLLDAIVETLPGELRNRYPKNYFENQLKTGNCLIMFDGFDELGSREARNKMAHLIDDLTNTYDHPRNHFIVSTRVVGYEGQLDTFGFTIRTVKDLDSQAVHDLVMRRYKAIAIGEGIGLSEQEQQDLLNKYEERAKTLLAELEKNEGLQELITNPLLLSLIVLVSLVQVKLPEQRHILYRDCVEVLTERWQDQRRAEAGYQPFEQPQPDDLTLDHKLTLLRHLALELQTRRDEDESQVLMKRSEACELISNKLPDFLAAHLPEDPDQRKQECKRKAVELLLNIREESGILVEKGLDITTGEPVIGFSHLTFQEYLAADAIRRQSEKLPLLLNNLFNPAWRESLLLYVSMEDGGTIIKNCLAEESQLIFARYLLAGRCLAEEGPLDAKLRRKVLDGLNKYFRPEDETIGA